MNPVLFVVAAVAFYAAQNVILELKLSSYSTVAIVACFYFMMLPMAVLQLGYMIGTNQPLIFPTGRMLWLALTVGVIYYVADYSLVSAYTRGVNSATVTTIAMTIPVFVSIGRYFAVGAVPSITQMVGYVITATGVYVVVKAGG